MPRFSLSAIALLAFLGHPAPGVAQTLPPDLPIVTVRGEGVVRMAESRARDPKEAQNANAMAMSAVLPKIAAAGIPKDAIRTLVVSLQQEYDYSGGRQTPRGYLARNIVEVRVDDLSKLGDVLDASVSSGATSIQGLEFDVKDRTKIEREALTRAVADATARAEAAASGARRTVDRVIRIDETMQGPLVRPQQEFRMAAEAVSAQPVTPVVEGEIEIRSVVTLTAVIK
jgi:uncharacterized protein